MAEEQPAAGKGKKAGAAAAGNNPGNDD